MLLLVVVAMAVVVVERGRDSVLYVRRCVQLQLTNGESLLFCLLHMLLPNILLLQHQAVLVAFLHLYQRTDGVDRKTGESTLLCSCVSWGQRTLAREGGKKRPNKRKGKASLAGR